MSELDHAHFMGLALQLVDQAEHRTSPNPIVGCVVVRESEVVGRGVTQPCGHSHAEVMALKDAGLLLRRDDVCDQSRAVTMVGQSAHRRDHRRGSKSLRRCHRQTPSAGRGLDLLKAAGIEAEAGVLGSGASGIMHRLQVYYPQAPWVTLKAGMTLMAKSRHLRETRSGLRA